MWSSATLVSTTTLVRRTFVASCRPPSPASTTATSTSASANASRAAAVRASNWVAPRAVARGLTPATARSKSASSPPTRMRSLQPRTCGDTYAPTLSPEPVRSASVILVVVDLPFVPTT